MGKVFSWNSSAGPINVVSRGPTGGKQFENQGEKNVNENLRVIHKNDTVPEGAPKFVIVNLRYPSLADAGHTTEEQSIHALDLEMKRQLEGCDSEERKGEPLTYAIYELKHVYVTKMETTHTEIRS